ncbi:hypothetical protein HMPREF0080_00600 [Anaeroglobus geminatus F0357]|uniref:Uncharacterized protein n=1 Tax=Anaeroglobus geminatus F0357 TaxID=861450 RepID=G9YG36_9FIRM|nr:hypothetical protein HMPREF0080_00600 [Anaeroglobus geminatus F0357]
MRTCAVNTKSRVFSRGQTQRIPGLLVWKRLSGNKVEFYSAIAGYSTFMYAMPVR